MNVLTKSVPQFDPKNVNASLVSVYNYLSSIMRDIDFILTKYRGQLGTSSLPDTSQEVKTMKGQLTALSSVVNGVASKLDMLEQNQEDDFNSIEALQGTVNGLGTRADKLETSINEVKTAIGEVQSGLAGVQSAVDELTVRVNQLEKQEGI